MQDAQKTILQPHILFESYGNTGINGKVFKAPERSGKLKMNPVHLAPGKEHTLAIHLVNYVPVFPLNGNKTWGDFFATYPLLSGPVLIQHTNDYYDVNPVFIKLFQ